MVSKHTDLERGICGLTERYYTGIRWSDGTEPGIKMSIDKGKSTETKENCVAANNTTEENAW
jgi:hypothetical protein